MKNSRTLARLLGVMLALVLVGSSCSGDSKDAASKDGGSEAAGDQGASGNTISVPDDQPTIQKAVDAAKPGDLIMVAAGTYKEAVDVETDRLTIRGADRNTTILDGGFKLENGIRVLSAKDLEVDMDRLGLKGSATQVRQIFTPPQRGQGILIRQDSARKSVDELMAKLSDAKIV